MNWIMFWYREIHWSDVLKLVPIVAVTTQLQGWWIAVGVLAIMHVVTVQISALAYGISLNAAIGALDEARRVISELGGAFAGVESDSETDA